MLGTYIRAGRLGLGVIVQVDVDKAYFTAIDLRKKSVLLVAVVAALAAVLGSLFAGEISRPVQKLATAAHRLAGGDYSTRVTVHSRNEVGVLADAFNQMGRRSRRAIEEIKRRAEENKELFMGSIRMLAKRDRREGPLHARPLRARGVLLGVRGQAPRDERRGGRAGAPVRIIHDVGKIGIEDKILRRPPPSPTRSTRS